MNKSSDLSSSALERLSSINQLKEQLLSRILGVSDQLDLLLTALIAGGHVLIQGSPGTGKTSLAKGLASGLDCDFGRIQFTPDLLPADILGYSVFNQKQESFQFHAGPIFSHILLADEINRTTPRIQSALLEAMNEAQVTVDGETHKLEAPFMVVATQNHFHSTGTFPLPESQLDRFLFSINMPSIDDTTRKAVLEEHLHGSKSAELDALLNRDDIKALQDACNEVYISDELMTYLSRLAGATYGNKHFKTGISTRAAINLMRASQAYALLNQRQAVYPDDIKYLTPFVFAHRLQLRGKVRQREKAMKEALQNLLEETSLH